MSVTRQLRPIIRRSVGSCLFCAMFLISQSDALALSRPSEPIVLSGARLVSLLETPVNSVVAFRYTQNGWEEIPVQIDERVLRDFGTIYGLPAVGITTMAYADPNTFTGADDDPEFDADDELVFMARDGESNRAEGVQPPTGVLPGVGVEVRIEDPLDPAAEPVFVYLFSVVSEDARAKVGLPDYVDYFFRLDYGSYLETYDTSQGPNPEDSEVVTGFYRTHFSERWIRDKLNIYAGGASGVDILDRHTNLFGPDICIRSEDTFSYGEGAFFANIDGPVRAIRSYLGANSGPLTERDQFFYDRRQEIVTTLRVHAIPGVMDLYDYGPGAIGMTYANSLNEFGVLVDGLQDAVVTGPITWEMITGSPGTMISTYGIDTNISPLNYTSYYDDEELPTNAPCTGDSYRFGLSGVWVNEALPSTDPLLGGTAFLQTRRTDFYDAPSLDSATAAQYATEVAAPLVAQVRPYPLPGADLDGDCFIGIQDYRMLVGCLDKPGVCAAKGCRFADIDDDCGVSLRDVAVMQGEFTGDASPIAGCEP